MQYLRDVQFWIGVIVVLLVWGFVYGAVFKR